jgi:hypothetical protein
MFTLKQINTIVNALQVAIELYNSDATYQRTAGNARLEEAFNRQATEAKELLDTLEALNTIR